MDPSLSTVFRSCQLDEPGTQMPPGQKVLLGEDMKHAMRLFNSPGAVDRKSHP